MIDPPQCTVQNKRPLKVFTDTKLILNLWAMLENTFVVQLRVEFDIWNLCNIGLISWSGIGNTICKYFQKIVKNGWNKKKHHRQIWTLWRCVDEYRSWSLKQVLLVCDFEIKVREVWLSKYYIPPGDDFSNDWFPCKISRHYLQSQLTIF